ncbi:unnamed protein product [Zymoseptoria tritici ST99CH_1E4]|uniref:F-box domain-containing protein n=1 Tax=Zymoseptoria tritici ST99CH_1E4 TaxID=1276532 RepID=A0A2H1GQ53_ZYMTR|nr:unnamed protein product [Zymoseptoria tritici ST99CH_1E4]
MLVHFEDNRRPLRMMSSPPTSSSALAVDSSASSTSDDATDEGVNATPPPPRPEPSACASVFALPELLSSHIIPLLPHHEIARLRLVSPLFHDNIKHSKALQRQLFLLPDHSIITGKAVVRDPAWRAEGTEAARYNGGRSGIAETERLARPNPSIFSPLPELSKSKEQMIFLLPSLRRFFHEAGPLHTGLGSLGEMYITQPPISVVWVGFRWYEPGDLPLRNRRKEWRLAIAGGVKVKDVVKCVLREVEAYDREKWEKSLEEGRGFVRLRNGFEVVDED